MNWCFANAHYKNVILFIEQNEKIILSTNQTNCAQLDNIGDALYLELL